MIWFGNSFLSWRLPRIISTLCGRSDPCEDEISQVYATYIISFDFARAYICKINISNNYYIFIIFSLIEVHKAVDSIWSSLFLGTTMNLPSSHDVIVITICWIHRKVYVWLCKICWVNIVCGCPSFFLMNLTIGLPLWRGYYPLCQNAFIWWCTSIYARSWNYAWDFAGRNFTSPRFKIEVNDNK